MAWYDAITDPIEDFVDDVGDFFQDPSLSSFGDMLWGATYASLNIITGGGLEYAKDAAVDYAQGLVDVSRPEREFKDRKRTARTAVQAREVIYGKVRTGGHLVYIEDAGKDNTLLWMCIVVAGHEVEEIEAVYFDNTKVATSNGAGVNGLMNRVAGTKFDDNFLVWSVHGNRSTAFIPAANWDYDDDSYDVTNASPPNWTTDHKLTYQSYVWINLGFETSVFRDSGIPSVTVDVKGKNDIYDPRNGSSGYTDNQALCTLDLLRWDRFFNAADSEIDMQSFADAADIADQQVTDGQGGTEPRYTMNGSFKMQTQPIDVLQSAAAAGAAFLTYGQGVWSIVPGAYSAPVMTLDESDLVGGLSFASGPSKRSRHNVAKGTYVDPDENYEPVGFPELEIPAYVTQDGEPLEKSFEFAFTNSGTMARRLAKIDIERNRFGASVTASFKFKAMQLEPGDRVALDNERLGWNGKVFRVDSMEISLESGVRLSLREDAPEIYDWEEGDALALDAPPVLSIPEGVGVSPPTSLSVTDELYKTITRAAVKTRMIVEWSDTASATAYDIQFRETGASAWIDAGAFWQDNQIEIRDVDDVDHDVRVRSIDGLGRRSAWKTVTYKVAGKTARPPDVDTVFIRNRALNWTYPSAPLDLAGFLVRFHNGTRQTWADATPISDNIITETYANVDEFGGTKTFLVRAIDTTGNVSQNSAIVTEGLGDPLVENVIASQSEAPSWSGTLVSGLINSDDNLQAAQIGTFYGNRGTDFYDPSGASAFYSDDYNEAEYQWDLTVAAQDAGSSITIDVAQIGSFDFELSYIPPGYSGGYLAFPGSINAVAGTHTFRIVIPAQTASQPPEAEDVITNLDVPDINESLNDVSISASGTRLPIAKTYRVIKNVSLTLQDDGGTATTAKVLDKDATNGPLVETLDGGTGVSGTIDARIQGY